MSPIFVFFSLSNSFLTNGVSEIIAIDEDEAIKGGRSTVESLKYLDVVWLSCLSSQ